MECVDTEEKTLIEQKKRNPIISKFQGLFLCWKHQLSFTEWVMEGILTIWSFYENHILQSYPKHSTCMTCLTRKRNVLSTDNKHSEHACSKSAILRNQLSTETTCNFLKIRCVNYWVKVNYQFRCLWNVTSFNASFFLL